MGAPSKRARKVRKAAEFNAGRLAAALRTPKTSSGAYAWDLATIRAARDAQLSGMFAQASRLAASMRTDDALFVAYQNRLAPQRGLPVKLCPPNTSARALRVLEEADGLFGPKGVGVTPETLANVNGDLANHGVAFATCTMTPRPDGSRIDLEVHYWPIEYVRWDSNLRCFVTQIESGSGHEADAGCYGASEVPIVHGDGRWIVFLLQEHEPWRHNAAVLPGALVWAAHSYANRDWANSSKAHGDVKLVGELPEGVALQDSEGAVSAEAKAMVDMLLDVLNDEGGVGVRPAGSKTDVLVNGSTAWQVFKELAMGSSLSASRIYLGTDGVVGTNPTGPGVDLRAMFGVRNDIVEGDLKAIEKGLLTGAIEPWAALNFGDSKLAPSREYLLPDADEDARRTSLASRQKAFFDDIKAARERGFDVTPDYIKALAADYGVRAPTLPDEAKKAPSITLAPTDIAKVVRVNEARASAGLGPLTLPTGALDPDGLLTVEEFSAKKAAAAATASTPSAPAVAARPAQPPALPRAA